MGGRGKGWGEWGYVFFGARGTRRARRGWGYIREGGTAGTRPYGIGGSRSVVWEKAAPRFETQRFGIPPSHQNPTRLPPYRSPYCDDTKAPLNGYFLNQAKSLPSTIAKTTTNEGLSE